MKNLVRIPLFIFTSALANCHAAEISTKDLKYVSLKDELPINDAEIAAHHARCIKKEQIAALHKCNEFHAALTRAFMQVNADMLEGESERASLSTILRMVSTCRPGHAGLIARALVQQRADVNARDRAGKTRLMCAAEQGENTVVQILLHAHAEVNAQDKNGNTALMHAALNKHDDVLQALLNTPEIDVGQTNKKGETVRSLVSSTYYFPSAMLHKIDCCVLRDIAKRAKELYARRQE